MPEFIYSFIYCFETEPHSVAQVVLELIAILLPQPSKYWDYMHELLLLVFFLSNYACNVSIFK